MAGANYEVNIQLKADPALKALERIEQKINGLSKSSTDLADRRAAAMVKLRDAGERLRQLEEKGLDLSKARVQIDKASQALDKGRLDTAKARISITDRELKTAQNQLNVEKQTTNQLKLQADLLKGISKSPGKVGPSGGGKLGQLALGAGFPLLFGGGPGAVIGGGLGGLTGGFAAQIGLSAIGQQFDNLGKSAIELGQALSDVNPNVEKLTEAAGFAGTETEMLLAKIERYGSKAQAAELATDLLATKVGRDGVAALKKFGKDAGDLGRALSTIFSQVLANIARIAGPLISFLARTAQQSAAVNAFSKRQGLTGKEAFAQKILTGQGLPQGKAAGKTALLQEAKKLGLNITTQQGLLQFAKQTATQSQAALEAPVLQGIETAAAGISTPGQAAAAKQLEKQLEKSKQKIELLKLETEEIKKITEFKNTIAALELAGDKQGAIRLELEQELTELNADKARAIAKIDESLPLHQQLSEQIAINEQFAAKEAEARAETTRQLNELAAKAADEQIKQLHQKIGLQHELNDAQKMQLELANSIANTLGTGMMRAFDALITGAQNWGAALRDIAANVLRDIARQLIQIYVIEQAISFFKTLLSPVSAFESVGKALSGAGALGGSLGIGGSAASTSYAGVTGVTGVGSSVAGAGNFSGFQGSFAKGGSVKGGMAALVGEKGPELFVPSKNGTIVPNNALGGSNIVVNVDAGGSNVQGDGNQAKALGAAIGAAVQAEIIKQKKPGGLLY